MTRELPFFPLGLIAFPGEQVSLHIFEPRYRELFADLQDEDGTFVLVPLQGSRLRSAGTIMQLQEIVKTYPSGELDVIVAGLQVVRIVDLQDPVPGKLYAGGTVKEQPLQLSSTHSDRANLLIERCSDLMRTLGVHVDLPNPKVSGLSFAVGHRVGLSPKQEFRLLTIESEDERQEYLLRAIERSIRIAEKTTEMRRKVQMNGHFRYLKSE